MLQLYCSGCASKISLISIGRLHSAPLDGEPCYAMLHYVAHHITVVNQDEAEEVHRVLKNKVKNCEEKGRMCILLGDSNAPINDSEKPFKKAA